MTLFERHTKQARKATAQPGPHVVEPCRYKAAGEEAKAAATTGLAEPAKARGPGGDQPVDRGHDASAASPDRSQPAALEPELRRVIDAAVARVAAIELDAIQQSRVLTQQAEQDGRENLKATLQRAADLMNGMDLFATTVNGMVSALQTEVDEALKLLEQVPDLETDAAPAAEAVPVAEPEVQPQAEPVVLEQPAPAPPAHPRAPEPPPEAEPVAAEPATNGAIPEAEAEPNPELTEMFREQIVNMRNAGKSREEAERSLLRFNLGRRFLPLLDEVYSGPSADARPPEDGKQRGLFKRIFSRA